MRKYKTVLFDMDGTLINTLYDLTAAVNHALEALNCPLHNEDNVRSFVGNGITTLMSRALPANADEKTLKQSVKLAMEYYTAHSQDKTRPYDGIVDMLNELKASGFKLGIVTNKPEPNAITVSNHYFPVQFEVVVGQREGVPPKPSKDGVITAMSALEAQKESTLYVGDSDVDFKTAENAGIDCALVSWGYQSGESLMKLGAKCVIHDVKNLKEFIMNS